MIWLLILLLTGCAAKADYPNQCHIDKPDADGKGYWRGQFPCKTTHHEGKGP